MAQGVGMDGRDGRPGGRRTSSRFVDSILPQRGHCWLHLPTHQPGKGEGLEGGVGSRIGRTVCGQEGSRGAKSTLRDIDKRGLREQIALLHGELEGWKSLSPVETVFLSEDPPSDIPWASEPAPAPVRGPSEDVYP